MTARNLIIAGPRDVNGNRREFYIRVYARTSSGDGVLGASTQPLPGGGIFATVNVTVEEYRRLARLFNIPLNDEDASAEQEAAG